MPIDYSTLERPSLIGRLLATIAEPGNYIGNRAVSGLHQLGSALYNAATGSSASDIVSRLNEIDAQRQAEDQRRWDYIMGEPGSSLTPVDHAFNAAGVIIPAASSTKSLVRGLTRKALASRAAGDAMKAGQAAQTIGDASRIIDEMIPFTRGTNFTNKDAMRFLQAAENPNGVRSAVADTVRNDNLLRSSIKTSNSVDDTVDMFARAGRLDPDTYVTLNNMKSGADIAGDISIARQPTLTENLRSAINKAASNEIIEAENLARAAGENLPRAWRNMSTSELVDIARDNIIREAWLNRLARQDLRNVLPNFGRSYVGFGLAGGYGNALGDAMSDLPYDAEAEARLAEVALSEPTSLNPTGTDTAVPTITLNNYEAFNPSNDSVLKSAASTSDSSGKTFEEQSYENTQKFLNASKETQQKWHDQMNKMRDDYNKQIRELRAKIASTETQESERKKYIDQLIETENKFVDEYWDNPINWILALPMAALDMRQFRNPVSMWNQRAMDYAQSQPEVRALMLQLGYTKDLPSQRDVLKDELGYIDSTSKADLSWLDQQRKDEQALLNAIIQANEQRLLNRLRESQIKKNEAYAEYLKNKPTTSPQEMMLWNLYNGNTISSFTNPSIGASPFKENN